MQDHLFTLSGVVADAGLLIDVGCHCVAILDLHLLDPLFGNAERADIVVDSVRANRNRRHIAHHVVVVDRQVGYVATHINHSDSLLLLVGFEQRLGRNQRIDVNRQRLDSQLQRRIGQTLNRGTQAQNEVERR